MKFLLDLYYAKSNKHITKKIVLAWKSA